MTSGEADVAAPAEYERSRLAQRWFVGRLVKIAFGVAVLTFDVLFVIDRWDALRRALSIANPGWIAVAVLFAVVG